MPIGHPAMPFDALLQPRIAHDSQTPRPDDHFAEHMSLCVFPTRGDPSYLPVVPFSALNGVYPPFSERRSESLPFLPSWPPPGSSAITAQRQVAYFTANDDTGHCFSGGSPSCSPILDLGPPGNLGIQWASSFSTEDTVPVGSVMDQREGVCGDSVLTNQLTWHVPAGGMRSGGSPTIPESHLGAQNSKEVQDCAGGTFGQSKMAERLKKGTRLSSRAESSSRGEGLSSTAEEACQSTPVARVALRTAPRKKKRIKVIAKKGESARQQRARTSHNLVEKEYRDRLRQYFEALLVVLPEGNVQIVEDEEAPGSSLDGNPASAVVEGQQKKLSKADVLAKACQHIEQLECGAKMQRLELDMLKEALEKS